MKNTNKHSLPIYIAFIIAATIVHLQAKVVNKIVAKVNGEPIMLSEYTKNKAVIFEQYRKMMPDFFQQKNAAKELESKVLEQMIDDVLMKQKAASIKIKVYDRELDTGISEIKKRFFIDDKGEAIENDRAEKAFLDELQKEDLSLSDFRKKIRGQIMVRKLIDQTIRPNTKLPSEKEAKDFFNQVNYLVKGDTSGIKNMPREEQQDILAVALKFKELTSEKIRVKHIFIKADENAAFIVKNKVLKRIRNIKSKLDKGSDFEELAEKHSEDKESASRGGDLGYIFKGLLPKKFEEKAFSMRVGEISKPVKTKFGYHIIKVDEKKAKQKLKFEHVKNEIQQLLSARNFKKELLIFVDDLRSSAKIKLFNEEK